VQNTENRFKEAITNKEFVVTCEMIPGRGAGEPSQEKEFAEVLKIWETGLVHAISITDNPGGNPALLADAVGVEFASKGMTPLVHFTCKDRSRNQIQAQLYALQRQGLSNILVMTGDYPVGGWEGRSRPSFDLDPIQVIMMSNDMNEGLVQKSPRGDYQEIAADFFAGAVVNPFKYTEGELIPQYHKLRRKLFAGAQYIITQLGYDSRKLDELQRYVKELGYDVPLIANVFIINAGAGRLMRKGSIAGCHISDDFFAVLEAETKHEDKGKAARYERAAQMVAIAKGMGYNGVHIGGHGITVEGFTGILERAEELKDDWQELARKMCYGEPGGFFYYNEAPESAGFLLNDNELAPRVERVRGSKIMRGYGISRLFHHLVLTRDKAFYGILKAIMSNRERKKGMNRHHVIEHTAKAFLYSCQDCGDCGLETSIYSCPMSYCPKNQRNGPCAGSMNGWCEVYPEERYCIWFRAYHRLKKYGETEKINKYITPPNNWDFYETSGWSNYTHERDNAAHRIMLDEEN